MHEIEGPIEELSCPCRPPKVSFREPDTNTLCRGSSSSDTRLLYMLAADWRTAVDLTSIRLVPNWMDQTRLFLSLPISLHGSGYYFFDAQLFLCYYIALELRRRDVKTLFKTGLNLPVTTM